MYRLVRYSAEELTQAAADLRAAADLIGEKGWVTGIYANDSGACCSAGAVNFVTNARLNPGPVSNETRWAEIFNPDSGTVMDVFHELNGMDIATYNDVYAGGIGEVMAKLRLTADEIDEHVRGRV